MQKTERAVAVGHRLRKAREAIGVSKRFAARKVGVSYSSMCQYEYGLRSPGDEVKIRIADFYEVPVQQLFYADE